MRPVITYGCEIWTTTKGNYNNTNGIERKVLKKTINKRVTEEKVTGQKLLGRYARNMIGHGEKLRICPTKYYK